MPLYPGTGAASETGTHGTIVNAPLRAGEGCDAFRAGLRDAASCQRSINSPAPTSSSSRPGSMRIGAIRSAGWSFDEADFAWATDELMARAERDRGGRLVSILEGGYDLKGLAGSVAAHVERLMARRRPSVSAASLETACRASRRSSPSRSRRG